MTPGQVLTNTTPATYTSLVNGGRSGADGGDDDVDDLLNNYTEQASSPLTVAALVAIHKTLTPRTLSVGETATYEITVHLIQGTTPNVVVTDVLPAGLSYVSHSIIAGNTGFTVSNPNYAQRLGSGQTVSFDFGNVVNPANGITTDDFGRILLTVRVDNVAANQDGTVLSNGENADGSEVFVTAGPAATRIDFDADGATPGNQGRPVTVVEPVLRIAKTPSPNLTTINGVPTAVLALGEMVTFTVTVEHDAASTADAFDVVVIDTLVSPTGTELTYVPGSASLPATDVTQNGNVLTFRIASLPRAAGSATFTYQALVGETAPTLTPGVLCNDATLTWASIPGATGAPDNGRTGGGGINDYTAISPRSCVVATAIAFVEATKTVADLNGGLVEPGDTLEYTVVLSDRLKNVDDVVFTDTVPGTTTFVPGTLTTTRGTTDESGAPTLRVEVGPLNVGETVTITFRVTVNAGVPAGTVIRNQGSVDSSSTVPELTDVDGTDANGDQPTDVIVGPRPTPASPLYLQKVVTLADDLVPALGTVNAGDVMRYTLIFSNLGSTTLHDVVASDTVPAGLSTTLPPASAARVGPPTITGSGSTISVTGQSLAITIPSIAPGEFVVAEFGVQVIDPLINLDGRPLQETFVNQATTSADGVSPVPSDQDGDPANGNQPTSFVAVAPGLTARPLLDVQKTVQLFVDPDGDSLVDPGDTVEWRITLQNAGAAAAFNVVLEDSLPPNTTLVPGTVTTSQGVVVSTDPTIGVNVGTVLPGRIVVVTFQTTVNPGTLDQTVIPNQAVASAANAPDTPSDNDANPENGLDPTTVVVVTDADLAITKTASPSPAAVGGTLTYTLTVTNDGPDVSPNTVVTDTLPAGVALVSVQPSQGTCTGSATVTCTLGDLAAGASATVTIVVRPTAEGSVRNVATVTGERPDPDPGDNTSTTETPVEALSDLEVTKSVAPEVVRLDEQITFTMRITNHGPTTATGVVVTDVLPGGVTFVSATADPGSCGATGGTVTCTIPTLASGATATIVVVTTRTSPDPIANTVTVDGNERDPDESNNTATASLTSSVPEDCGNCEDDDGDGLIDAEDDDCCTAQGLTFTSTRLMSRKSQLRAKGRFAKGAFAGIDPRQETIRLQVRDANGRDHLLRGSTGGLAEGARAGLLGPWIEEHVRAGDEPLSDRAEARTHQDGHQRWLAAARAAARRHAARRHAVCPG